MQHGEAGMRPGEEAIRGAGEVGFTVLSISSSLVAVFIPIFFMPGTIGLLFHEFAIVVTLSILVSAAVSLTLIPILVPMLVKDVHAKPVPLTGWFDTLFARTLAGYQRGLEWALTHRAIILLAGLSTFSLTAWVYAVSPQGL